MNIHKSIQRLLEKSLNIHVFRYCPRGIDLRQDLEKLLPKNRWDTVFDVGANVGQSAETYIHWFPDSEIFCFEPSKDTFERLKKNTSGNDRITVFQLAFGASKSRGKMSIKNKTSTMNSLLREDSNEKNRHLDIEEVDIERLDDFCNKQNIKRISFLKVDTEGWDLDVLKGAERMLNDQAIDVVEVEAGMNPKNRVHVPLEELKQFLESKNYFLFGIYQQMGEFFAHEPHLRRTNPVFVSQRVIDRNKGCNGEAAL